MDSTDPIGGMPGQRLYSEEISSGAHDYSIDMGGGLDDENTRDPVGYGHYGQAWEGNLWVRLENTGTTEVLNPWLCANGRDWRSLETVLDGILEPSMGDADKARAVWEFARRHRYHFTTGDDEVKDTVKMLNVYGYTLCWDEAYTVANLWKAAGLKTRRGFPHGHCTTEVFYDGEYHLMDSDEHLLVLRRDNRSVAGETDIARDHDLLKRSHTYGILAPENRRTSEGAASLFVHTGPRAGDRSTCGGHRMDLRLRPGEALVWAWQDRGLSHGPRPPRLCNGHLEFTPRLDGGFRSWALQADNLQPDGDGLLPVAPKSPSLLQYGIDSPYVLVGARLAAEVESGCLWAEFSADGRHWQPILRGNELEKIDVRFNNALPRTPAPYACQIRLRGNIRRLRHLHMDFDLQMAPLSLPGLRLGRNRLHYSDQSAERRVRLTHAWRERAATAPLPPVPVFPAADGTVAGTQFTFAWDAVPGAVDYHFELSEYADFRHCLSPVFEKLSSRTPARGAPRWRIPEEGLLNPDTPYYWRVRARDGTGLWGPFSVPCTFSVRTPAPPQDLKLDIDWETRCAVLHWEDGTGGSPPTHYQIHASDERGFSTTQRSRAVFGGNEGEDWVQAPTLIKTVGDRRLAVVEPTAKRAFAFYRVVAVDADGVRSGASDWIGMPRPFICSLPPRQVAAGRLTTYRVRCIRSDGELLSISRGARRYASAHRQADHWRFLLDEGPAWLSLDENSGVLLASPPVNQQGLHTVTLRVSDGQGRADVQGFDLEVTPPGESP